MPPLVPNLKFLGFDREITENMLRPGKGLPENEYGFKVSFHATGENSDGSVRRYHYFTTPDLGTRQELEEEFKNRLIDEYLGPSNLTLIDFRLEMGWK